MTTNIHYLIAGMAVLLVVIWQYSRQRQMDDRNSRMFRRLLSVVSLDVAAELVSTGFILYAPYSFNVCRMLSNTVFYLFQALLPLLLLYYVCTLCTSRVIAPSAVLRMGIPTIALVCIILTNPFTEMLFYFDGTGYRHGPWYLLLYVSALLHIAGAAVFVAVHRASVSRRNLASLFAVFALAALGIAAQAVNPEVLTTGFGLSLSILAMYLTINNPCACMDSLTGLNDKQYLLRRMDELTDAHKAFHIITVYAYQLDHMNKIAGMRGGDEFLRRAAERMQEIAGRNVFRVTGRCFLLLTFSLREYETCLTRLRELFHTQPDDAQSAPTPVILCGVVNAEKLGTSGLVLDYAEYLESLVSQSGIETLSDLAGKTIAVQATGKPEAIFLRGGADVPAFRNIISLADRGVQYAMLDCGYTDAIAAHEEAIRQYMKDYGANFRILDEPLLVTGIGVAFSKNDTRGLAAQLDEVFEQMREDGSMEKLVGKYLDDPAHSLEVDALEQ